MIVLHTLSIVLLVVAFGGSLVLLWRLRDQRLSVLSAFLAALSVLQVLHSEAVAEARPGYGIAAEALHLTVALLGLTAVVVLGNVLEEDRARIRRLEFAEETMRRVAESVVKDTGQAFFQATVERVAEILEMDHVFVGELEPAGRRIHKLASRAPEGVEVGSEYSLEGTPCEHVVGYELCVYPRGVWELFPHDPGLKELGIECYLGMPLSGADGRALGLLAAMHTRPYQQVELASAVLQLFGSRVASELEREGRDAQLRASELRYRRLFEGSHDAIILSTPEGELIDANPAAVELLGFDTREELQRSNARELYVDPQQQSRLWRVLEQSGRVTDVELKLRRKDGRTVVVLGSAIVDRDDQGLLQQVPLFLRNVTEERELQAQLLQSQRMEAVGRMAGGVAHDFNNLLTLINGHSDLVLTALDPPPEVAAEVVQIKAAAQRAAAFTRRLLLLSRRKVVEPEVLDLTYVISGLEKLLRRAIGEDIRLEIDLDAPSAKVRADPGQMEQVLLNLAINARDAMPGGGELLIQVREVQLGAEEATVKGVAPGDFVRLRVEDSGKGIEPRLKQRIFEPFFTTKDPQIGTGLGLSTVYGIVEQYGGAIEVESTPGEGACFDIFLPRTEAQPERGDAERPERRGLDGSERILLVEDEPAVRNLLEQALLRQGYRVVPAATGEEALRLAESEGPLDLVVTDLVMPGMDGVELVRRLKSLHPEIRALYISGYSDRREVSEARDDFLQKPFAPDRLLRKVRGLFDSGAVAE